MKGGKGAQAKPEGHLKFLSAPQESEHAGPQAAVGKFFLGHPNTEFSTKELAERLGMKVQTVGLIASKLVHSGLLEKTETGKFRRPEKP